MKILVLGGTGFLGPHFLDAARSADHEVTIFNRGVSESDVPSDVERLVGDRDGDLRALERRSWDAVVDLAVYAPAWVRSIGELLAERAGHYTFVSTISVYRFPGAFDEQSELLAYDGDDDPFRPGFTGAGYGALKALCEEEARRRFPGRAAIIRPGHIVGPRETAGAFTYLAARFARGGEILVAGDAAAPVQLIDARDLAEWSIRMAEDGVSGTFTAVGPPEVLSWSRLVETLHLSFPEAGELVPVAESFLTERGIGPFSAPLFWPTEVGQPGMNRLSSDRARAAGLRCRPLGETIAATSAWYESLPSEVQDRSLLGFRAGTAPLAESLRDERELLEAWRRTT